MGDRVWFAGRPSDLDFDRPSFGGMAMTTAEANFSTNAAKHERWALSRNYHIGVRESAFDPNYWRIKKWSISSFTASLTATLTGFYDPDLDEDTGLEGRSGSVELQCTFPAFSWGAQKSKNYADLYGTEAMHTAQTIYPVMLYEQTRPVDRERDLLDHYIQLYHTSNFLVPNPDDDWEDPTDYPYAFNGLWKPTGSGSFSYEDPTKDPPESIDGEATTLVSAAIHGGPLGVHFHALFADTFGFSGGGSFLFTRREDGTRDFSEEQGVASLEWSNMTSSLQYGIWDITQTDTKPTVEIEYWPYANSTGAPVWDTTTGSQLVDPAS